MSLKSQLSVSDVVDRVRKCPECGKKGFLAFIKDEKGTGMKCDYCGSRLEFIAKPKLQIRD